MRLQGFCCLLGHWRGQWPNRDVGRPPWRGAGGFPARSDSRVARYRCCVASEDVIQAAGRCLAAAATRPAKVILFGSHAQGAPRPDSDLDLLVIESDLADRNAEFVRLRRSLRGLGVPVDLILVSEDNVDEWRDVPGTLIHDAFRDGRVLAEG
jgi:predicted nucleotidyltransferase